MTEERKAKIAGCAAFYAIATDSFFEHPNYRDDIEFAKSIGKKITFFLKEGTVIPPGGLKDVDRVIKWRTTEDLEVVAKSIHDEIHEQFGPGEINVVDGCLPD